MNRTYDDGLPPWLNGNELLALCSSSRSGELLDAAARRYAVAARSVETAELERQAARDALLELAPPGFNNGEVRVSMVNVWTPSSEGRKLIADVRREMILRNLGEVVQQKRAILKPKRRKK